VYKRQEFQILGSGLKVGQKFTVKKDEQYGSGAVVKQNPSPGSQVRIGDVIDVWVTPEVENSENTTNEQILH
jgi:beta-lactam-binding protein with PASTA domain